MHQNHIAGPRSLVALLFAAIPSLAPPTFSQEEPPPVPPPSLKTVPVPLPADLDTYVRDRDAAVRLGKAFYWDTQVGGDGQVACATCHYHAGVDNRSNDNTVHPGPNGVVDVILPLDPSDFPFNHDDRIGSQGVAPRTFNAVGFPVDDCDGNLAGVRQKTGRNAPPFIGGVFNRHNFWDNRARRIFNGVNPAGGGVGGAIRIWINHPVNGLRLVKFRASPASAASQAVGPPNNEVEMSCLGRSFADLGRKMVNSGLAPLGQQIVDPTDSALGGLSNSPAPGLATTYRDMIRAAFRDRYTSDDLLPDGSGFTQIEANFSLFWGIGLLLYASTVIPDDTPFDRFQDGVGALTPAELRGLQIFLDEGRCAACHGGAEFTNASHNIGGERASANTGVRPVAEDGGEQPDSEGIFKTSHLRNIELSGPYFHNGGYLTLRQVVEFYNRGADHPNDRTDSQVRPLGLTDAEMSDLVAFLLTLTDDRVRFESAPFDRPSIVIPNGPALPAVGAAGRDPGDPLRPFLWTGDPQFHFQSNP